MADIGVGMMGVLHYGWTPQKVFDSEEAGEFRIYFCTEISSLLS